MNTPKSNPKNDRVKRDYLIWLKEAKQRSAATVEQVRHSIDRFETYNRFKDFSTFNREQAIGFKRALLSTKGHRSKQPLSITTVHHTLQSVKDFLAWLHGRPGFARSVTAHDIAYLNLTKGEERQARTATPKPFPSIDEYRAAIFAMPSGNEVERRNQAIMALLLLLGIRDAALVGLKMQDVDLDQRYVFQNPRHADTKFRKAIDSFFLPVGEDIVAIFSEWITFLRSERDFSPDDPVFPKTAVGPGEDRSFTAQGLSREHWADAAPVRQCFRDAFARIILPFTKPHSVRDTLVQLAYRWRFNAEQMKALSQNLGHDKPLTTFNSYGPLTRERQGEVIRHMAQKTAGTVLDHASPEELLNALATKLRN
jgi:integrase/recombinase XerD